MRSLSRHALEIEAVGAEAVHSQTSFLRARIPASLELHGRGLKHDQGRKQPYASAFSMAAVRPMVCVRVMTWHRVCQRKSFNTKRCYLACCCVRICPSCRLRAAQFSSVIGSAPGSFGFCERKACMVSFCSGRASLCIKRSLALSRDSA